MYPEVAIHHLARTHSNHCPVLLKMDDHCLSSFCRPFRFQPMWMSHPLFPKVVVDFWTEDGPLKLTVEKFTADVKIWNREVFGDIFQRKKRIEARLRGIQTRIADGPNYNLLNLECQLRKEYFEVLQYEEEFWSVKSRYNSLIQGDRNTKFFHTSALVRRRRNKILYLQDSLGNWVQGKSAIADLVRSGFIDLFSTSVTCAPRLRWRLSTWPSFLGEDEASTLCKLD